MTRNSESSNSDETREELIYVNPFALVEAKI